MTYLSSLFNIVLAAGRMIFVGDPPCSISGTAEFLGVFVGILVKVRISKVCSSNVPVVMFASALQRAEQDILRER